MDLLLLPAQMQAPKWRSDNSVTITLVTATEISDEQFLHLSKYKKVNGMMGFGPNKFDPKTLLAGDAPVRGHQTRAQRIRSKLFKLYAQRGGKLEDFEVWYEKKMSEYEQLIDDALD